MSRICIITKKKTIKGNKISHANNKTKRYFYPNLQKHKIFIKSKKKWINLRISNAALRLIKKKKIKYEI